MSSTAVGAKYGGQSLMQTSLGFLRRGEGRPLQKQRLATMIPKKDQTMPGVNNNVRQDRDEVQFLMQYPSGSSEEARGDPCKATVSQDGSQEDHTMLFEKQFVNNADGSSSNSAANLLSAAQPMHERPQVNDGPYAPVKYKKGQKVLDDFAPDDSELARKAEYEDLKRRLDAAYLLKSKILRMMRTQE